jgi:tellurium resistance protein TerD
VENYKLQPEIQIYFDWKETAGAIDLHVIPVYESTGKADTENITKDGVKKDRTAYPYPDGKIADNALTFVPSYPGNFKAMVKIQTGGLPNTVSKILIVFSGKTGSGELANVSNVCGGIATWLAIPTNKMDIYGSERLNETNLNNFLSSEHAVPMEIAREGGNWVLKQLADGHETYRSVLAEGGFDFLARPTAQSGQAVEQPEPVLREAVGQGESTMREAANTAGAAGRGTRRSIASPTSFVTLIKGQRVKIDPAVSQVEVVLDIDADFAPDVSCFILDGQTRPKAVGEELIFYGQPVGAGGAVRYDNGKNTVSYDLKNIAPGIEKLAVVVSVYDPGRHFGQARKLAVKFISEPASYIFEPDVKGTTFTAIEICEVYRKDGLWRFNAKGTGVTGGLAELCGMYGVEVE